MKRWLKIFVALLAVASALAGVAVMQERMQVALLDEVRGALPIGALKEEVEREVRARGLVPDFSADGRTCTVHVWFHFRRDVAVLVHFNERATVAQVAVREHHD